jgi:hypothetical protein
MPTPRLSRLRGWPPSIQKWFDMVVDVLEYQLRFKATPPLQITDTQGGPVLSLAPVKYLVKAKTGASGIPAAASQTEPGAADVTLYEWDASEWVATTETVTGWNPSTSGPVAGNTMITLGWVDNQMYEVVTEPCP